MKPDQERVRALLSETVALLCKNGLHYRTELRIQGLLGITIDGSDVFIVHLDECVTGTNISVRASDSTDSTSVPSSQFSQLAVDLTATASVELCDSHDPRMPTLVSACSLSHRQRRKQSSPRREHTTKLEEQETNLFEHPLAKITASDARSTPESTVETNVSSIRNQIKIEQTDDLLNNGSMCDQGLNVAVKQEGTAIEDNDVIFLDSRDESSESSVEALQFQARAEEMATNWLSGMANRVASFNRPFVKNTQRRSLGDSTERMELESQFEAWSRHNGRAVSDSVADFKLYGDSSAGCSTWQFSNSTDSKEHTIIPASQNSIQEVCSWYIKFSTAKLSLLFTFCRYRFSLV